MNKKYEYNGNIYCEDDLSEEIYNYGGDLDDLFLCRIFYRGHSFNAPLFLSCFRTN